MLVIKCDKCKKEFEILMVRCDPAYLNNGGMSYEQEITVMIPEDVMCSLKRKGSGEVLCRECWS